MTPGFRTPSQLMSEYKRRVGISEVAIVATFIVLVGIVAAAAVYPSTSSQPSVSSSTSSSTSISQPNGSAIFVSITNGAGNPANPPGYAPDVITVVVGVNNTVTWTNNDSVPHTVTSASGPSSGSFDSGTINSGKAWTHTFTITGTYDYICRFHGWMKGTIVVKAGA